MANVKGGRYVESLYYPIENPNTGEKHYPSSDGNWRYNKEDMQTLIENDEIYWGKDGTGRPKLKRFLSDVQDGVPYDTIWTDNIPTGVTGTHEIKSLFGSVNVFDTPKPEALMKEVIELTTNEGDILLDFFAGSGTTGAVAHKLDRQYIICEQMDYIDSVTMSRLQKVIKGEQGGISEEVEWQGGGSFIYTELHQSNATYVEAIEEADSSEELSDIWERMKEEAFLSYRIKPKDIDESKEEFEELTLDQQKQLLIDLLDKNQLYINYSEIEDERYGIAEYEKRLNDQFYNQ